MDHCLEMAQAKAAEGRPSPRRQTLAGAARTARRVLDCASPLALGGRMTLPPEAERANVPCNCQRQPARPLRWFEPFDQALMAGLHPVGHRAIPPRRRRREMFGRVLIWPERELSQLAAAAPNLGAGDCSKRV